TVLIAEDTDMNFVFLMEALKPTGINVMRAHDGKEAIALCEENRFIDLVLMDITMPHIDGFEATRQIKANRNIPVIAQTALNIDEAESKSKAAGCDDYILKPIRLNDFLTILAKYLH
ncbi:MAG: response regulator, partial [Bacteroidales bacterium]